MKSTRNTTEIHTRNKKNPYNYLLGYCHNVGGVLTAFCMALGTPIETAAAAAAAFAVSVENGIMVEFVPVKNMF